MRSRVIRNLLGFASFLLLAGSSASNSQPQQAPPAAPVVRVTTRLVEVGVIVHHKDGQPVTGLTEKDFTLLEDSKEQKLRSLDIPVNRLQPARPAL